MIEGLIDEDLIDRIGGRFKLTAMIQRRWLQLLQGARPMGDTKGKTDLEIIVQEIVEGKIELVSLEQGDDEEDAA